MAIERFLRPGTKLSVGEVKQFLSNVPDDASFYLHGVTIRITELTRNSVTRPVVMINPREAIVSAFRVAADQYGEE